MSSLFDQFMKISNKESQISAKKIVEFLHEYGVNARKEEIQELMGVDADDVDYTEFERIIREHFVSVYNKFKH